MCIRDRCMDVAMRYELGSVGDHQDVSVAYVDRCVGRRETSCMGNVKGISDVSMVTPMGNHIPLATACLGMQDCGYIVCLFSPRNRFFSGDIAG
eukprot:10026738-Prorocentrum_lima.AAC.1